VRSFAIVATTPKELRAELHNRMPVILAPQPIDGRMLAMQRAKKKPERAKRVADLQVGSAGAVGFFGRSPASRILTNCGRLYTSTRQHRVQLGRIV
jgi:hypothetical protein